jgi:hypothetical protein
MIKTFAHEQNIRLRVQHTLQNLRGTGTEIDHANATILSDRLCE